MDRIACLFPGQGAQTLGMGGELYETFGPARERFDAASAILGYDLAELCREGPVERLNSTVCSQPALFVASLAAADRLQSEQADVLDSCGAAAGLSLGEYTALVFSGAMEFEPALRVVQKRGQAMQDASDARPSGMVSIIGLDRDVVEQLCADVRHDREVLEPANFLCPGQVAVSGDRAACERIVGAAESQGAMKCIPLDVAGAFHTEIMQPAVEPLRRALDEVEIRAPRFPVLSNVDGRPHDDPQEIRRLLVEQVVSPVRWEDGMRGLLESGFNRFYEIGPGRVLRGLLRRIERKVACDNVPA